MGRAIDAARRAFDETDWSTQHRVAGALHASAAATRCATTSRNCASSPSPRSARRGCSPPAAQLEGPVDDLSFCADTAESYAVEHRPRDSRRRWASRPAAPSRARPSASSARSPRGTSRTRSTSPSSGPALAAGNTVVLKPAPDTPWCAAVLGELIAEHTDIPPGVVNIVTSSDHGVGALLSKDPRVDMVSFTGSTAHRPRGDGRRRRHAQEGVPGTRRQVGVPGARRRRSGGRVLDVGVHRVHARRPGLRDHHPTGGAAGPLRRGRRGRGGHHGGRSSPATRRTRHRLRAGDLGAAARPGAGLPRLGDRRGRHVRLRRWPSRRPRHRVLHRADRHRGTGQRRPGRP